MVLWIDQRIGRGVLVRSRTECVLPRVGVGGSGLVRGEPVNSVLPERVIPSVVHKCVDVVVVDADCGCPLERSVTVRVQAVLALAVVVAAVVWGVERPPNLR